MPPFKPHHNPIRRDREEDDGEKQKQVAVKNSKKNTLLSVAASAQSNRKQQPQREIIVVSSSDEDDDDDDDECDEESDIYYTSTDENVENTYLAEEEEEEEEEDDDEWDDRCDCNYGDDDDLSSCDTDEDDSIPAFVMLFGIPGSGKSTWCKKFMNRLDTRNARVRAEIALRNKEKSNGKSKKGQDAEGGKKKATKNSTKEKELKIHEFKIISSDDVRREIAGSINNQSFNEAVWDEVLARVQNSLKRGINTILDATNVGTSNRVSFISKLPPCRLKLQSFSCVDEYTAQRRIERDLERGVDRSAVPEKVVSRMRAQLDESIPNLRDEGWTVFNEGKYLD